jgi:uncharacterized protein (TIGR02145 family)
MKKIYSLLTSFLLAVSLMAQAPQSFNYQAVVRNAVGEIIESKLVGMRISILQGSINGTVVCTEEFSPTTNAFGLVTLTIGTENPTAFDTIDWSAGPYFVKVELDPAGGTNYTNMGTSQLISVPYALYAKTSETAIDAVLVTGDQTISGNKTFTGTIDVNNKVITNAGTPVNTTDVANKAYVDEVLVKILDIQAEQGVKDFDGNEYKAVRIGNQVWMAENLKTTHYADGTALIDGKGVGDLSADDRTKYWFVYGDSMVNKATYGLLYTWAAAMNGASSSSANPSGIQGVCPAGWHLPSNAEWITLEEYLIAHGYNYDGTTTGNKIAKALASTTNWQFAEILGAVGNTDFPLKRNITGFTGLPGGGRGNDGIYYYIGQWGLWWTSTGINTINVWGRAMKYFWSYLERGDGTFYENGISVRCVKD